MAMAAAAAIATIMTAAAIAAKKRTGRKSKNKLSVSALNTEGKKGGYASLFLRKKGDFSLQRGKEFGILNISLQKKDWERENAMKLFEYANGFCKETTWKDLALLKFCLCAIGLMMGACVSEEKKRPALVAAAAVFALTYPPLMARFIQSVLRQRRWERRLEEEPVYYGMED